MFRAVAAATLAVLTIQSAILAENRDDLAFFESKIRPVLVQECFACHAADAKKVRGGLRLDSREGMRIGGDSGPAIVPGKPEESLLIEALRHDGLAMPPKSKLSDAIVRDFERWIRVGAPDPREGEPAPKRTEMNLEAGRAFWAYQPPRRHAAPTVQNGAWPKTRIDFFLLAALEAKGLEPVRDAERAVLIRRVYDDLVGLPPTPAEVAAFEADGSPDAYEQLVDRLLASPRFGERWGRHWLDVSRFGESLTLRGFVFKEAWRYRDYVIESMNSDLPFDQFVREQIAGDLLPFDEVDDRRRMMPATTFLAMGNTNLEEQDKAQLEMDVVDEQLDTIGKAFLAQTIGCARCHDHKFDPIPTRDYYAMAAILRNVKTLEHANVSQWIERPLPLSPEAEAKIQEHERSVATIEEEIKKARARANLVGGIVIDNSQAKVVGEWKTSQHTKPYIGDGYLHDDDSGKGEKTVTFEPKLQNAGTYDVCLCYTPGSNRSRAVPVTIFSADGERTVTVDMQAVPTLYGNYVSLGRYKFEQDGLGFVLIANAGTVGHVIADAVAFIPQDDPSLTAEAGKNDGRLHTLEAELKRLKVSGPSRDMVLSVVENGTITDTRIHIRGSVHNLGEPVSRGFLRVASVDDAPTFPSGESGRRELAGWLSDRRNPLTARVIVNRAWHWVFGDGLVRTVDNFGATGEMPSHPELLDDLAVEFMDEGWSLKRLVRTLVLSHAYRLSSSGDRPELVAFDPENQLRGRMPRRRRDAESIRDAMLSASGELRFVGGGPTFPAELRADYGYSQEETIRSVYLPVFRNSLPELFTLFDFADPSMVVGQRDVSTVAPQALYFLNHPFVAERSRHAARRLLDQQGLDEPGRIDRAFQVVLGRPPSDDEAAIVGRFLSGNRIDPDAWSVVFQMLFASPDFRYVD